MVDQESFANCLPNVESRWGKAVLSEVPIFELNATYAIELKFDKHCQVVWVQIAPKYVWETTIPAWSESRATPELSTSEYEDALVKINQLRLIGALVHKGDSGIFIVTNSKQHAWDEHQEAFVNRVMHCCDGKSAFVVSIYFLQRQTRKITKYPLYDIGIYG